MFEYKGPKTNLTEVTGVKVDGVSINIDDIEEYVNVGGNRAIPSTFVSVGGNRAVPPTLNFFGWSKPVQVTCSNCKQFAATKTECEFSVKIKMFLF
jgi:hypothetical protein